LVVKVRPIHRQGAAWLGMSTAARRLQLGVEVGALLERDDVAWRCTSRWWLRDAAHSAGDDVSQRIQKAPTQRSLPPSLLHPLPFSSGAAVNFRAGERGGRGVGVPGVVGGGCPQRTLKSPTTASL
jgi:hypothetical protein